MMCEKCGTLIRPGNLYCEKCGAPIVTDPEVGGMPMINGGAPIEEIPEISVEQINAMPNQPIEEETNWETSTPSAINPGYQGSVPVIDDSIPELIPVVEPVVEPTFEEDNPWNDLPKEVTPLVMPSQINQNNSTQTQMVEPVYQAKPDLLRGMNDPTQEQIQASRRKEAKRQNTVHLINLINRWAIRIGILIVGLVILYVIYSFIMSTGKSTKEYLYQGYAIQIDQAYQTKMVDNTLSIIDSETKSELNIVYRDESYKTFESDYKKGTLGIIESMKEVFGSDAMKKMELKEIEGQNFIVFTIYTNDTRFYICYTKTSDDKVLEGTYSQTDHMLNQSNFVKMARSMVGAEERT